MRLKYKLGLAIVVVAIGICLMTYQSYALWVVNLEGQENVVSSGCFKIEFEQINAPIMMNNTYPMSDSKGLSGIPYKFKITNKCSIASKYYVTLNTLTTNQQEDYNLKEKIKFAIHKETEAKPTAGINLGEYASDISHINEDRTSIVVENMDESIILAADILNQGEEETYSIYLWYDEKAGNEIMNQKFEGSINILSTATNKKEKTAVEYIKDKSLNNNELVYDGTSENNLRYIGANPNNYVSFNNELWRIIGVMENVDDGTGKSEARVKIVREDTLGRYAWDSSPSEINEGKGINEWSQAKLNTLLNDYYYNRKADQICYNGPNMSTTSCSFDTNGILEETKKLFSNALWHTGAYLYSNFTTVLVNDFYNQERSEQTGKICTQGTAGCNDTVDRTSTWMGQIGILSGSDYGYATSGDDTITRETCLNTPLRTWDQTPVCYENNWLYRGGAMYWLINPMAYNEAANAVFDIVNRIGINDTSSDWIETYPTIYLNANVKIISGSGTSEQPYRLSL